MAFCTNRGNQLPVNSKFCNKCGAPQQSSMPAMQDNLSINYSQKTDTPQQIPQTSAPVNRGYPSPMGSSEANLLFRAGPNNKTIMINVICLIFIVLLAFVFWNYISGEMEMLRETPY